MSAAAAASSSDAAPIHDLRNLIQQRLAQTTAAAQLSRKATNMQQGHQPHRGKDETLAVLLPIIILLASLLFLLILSLIVLVCARRRRGGLIRLTDRGAHGPADLADDEELEQGPGGIEGLESRWLDTVSEPVKLGYIRAKAWQAQFPPDSQPTDITLTQFLAIQEKGVSAWCFEADYDNISPPFLITGRTEINFLADGMGMASEEGGGSSVQSNLPIPKINEVYYFEAKLYEKPDSTNCAIGLATKPYPSFRMPGWNRHSVGYFSADGFKSYNYPFTASSHGAPLHEGDVLGVGYRPRSGTVFFTRNGRKLEDAYVGFNKHNVFPTIGSDGPASIHVNLGQSGFVFIEANVKKWGLAPSSGTLAPPPAYGSERGSILLEASGAGHSNSSNNNAAGGDPPSQLGQQQQHRRRSPGRRRRHRQSRLSVEDIPETSSNSNRRPAGASRLLSEGSSRSSRQATPGIPEEPEQYFDDIHSSRSRRSPEEELDEDQARNPLNPPTPNMLDISLQSLRPSAPISPASEEDEPLAAAAEEDSAHSDASTSSQRSRRSDRSFRNRGSPTRPPSTTRAGDPAPPAYHVVDPNTYAPGVAEAMLGESFAQFQAMQNFNANIGSPGSLGSMPSSAQYEGSGRPRSASNNEPSLALRIVQQARSTVAGRPRRSAHDSSSQPV